MTHTQRAKVMEHGTASEKPTSEKLRGQIEQLAYTFYCQCGYEHGHDIEHWLEAEGRVLEHTRAKTKARG